MSVVLRDGAEGVTLEDHRRAAEVAADDLDPGDAVDEVHRRDDGAHARREVGVLPVGLPGQHRGDELARASPSRRCPPGDRPRAWPPRSPCRPRGASSGSAAGARRGTPRRSSASRREKFLTTCFRYASPSRRPLERAPEGEGAIDGVPAVGGARAGHLEERDPAVGQRLHRDELGRPPPLALDEVQARDRRVAGLAWNGAAEEVGAQRLAVGVAHLQRKEGVGGAPLARRERPPGRVRRARRWTRRGSGAAASARRAGKSLASSMGRPLM